MYEGVADLVLLILVLLLEVRPPTDEFGAPLVFSEYCDSISSI